AGRARPAARRCARARDALSVSGWKIPRGISLFHVPRAHARLIAATMRSRKSRDNGAGLTTPTNQNRLLDGYYPRWRRGDLRSIRRLLFNTGELARQDLDHGEALFGHAAHPVDPPFLGVLACHNVLAQGRKSLGFQLIQDRRKRLRKRCAGITDRYDLKTGCKQIAAYFI